MLQNLIVDLRDFERIEKIGSGSFGKVYLVKEKETNKFYVAKVLKNGLSSSENQMLFFNETTTCSKIKHQAVLSLIGFNLMDFKNRPRPTLLTKYMPNGSLQKYVKNENQLTNSKRYIILLGIALGMEYLHSHSIIHRDLKPDNVLLNEKYQPLICDFGESLLSDISVSQIVMSTAHGTPLYMAPELLLFEPYTYKSDVYSYSILAYEVITCKSPFPKIKTMIELKKAVTNMKRPNLDFIQSEPAKDLLSKCWSHDPENRPKFKKIVETLKKEEFINSMNVNKREVESYLSQFKEKLPQIITSNKHSSEENEKDEKEQLPTVRPHLPPIRKSNAKTPTKQQCENSLKESADRGDVKSMLEYANMLYEGIGVVVDKKEAARYYKMAADKGNSNAMNIYGFMLKKGDGIAVDKKEAARYFKMAADKGNSNAMNNYGFMLKKGDGIAVDKKEAARYFKMAADKGNSNALNIYGFMLQYDDGIAVDKKEAARYYKMAIDKGNSYAMNSYGFMLKKGDGIAVDKKEAARYYKMAADKGYPIAMNSYGFMLDKGDGIAVDKKEAARYFKMAADKGDSDAMYNYGLMLQRGDGIAVDKKEALRYLKMAADKGNRSALNECNKIKFSK